MSVFKHAQGTEIRFGADANHVSYVWVRALLHVLNTVELRFKTTFSKAKYRSALQINGQHFMSKTDLRLLRDRIDELLSGQRPATGMLRQGDNHA